MPRPDVSDETIQEVEEVIGTEIRIPPERLSFEKKVQILLEVHEEALNTLDVYREGSATQLRTGNVPVDGPVNNREI